MTLGILRMKLSEQAWVILSPIVHEIIHHPFNQQMMKGTLRLNKFGYYIEQDMYYLENFSNCHAIIATKAPTRYRNTFLHYSDDEFIEEQAHMHDFFQAHYGLLKTNKISRATQGYTNFLLRTACFEAFELNVAATLPCFWIYKSVARALAPQVEPSNPYFRWLETYTRPNIENSTQEMIAIFDEIARSATPERKAGMLNAVRKSAIWEWRFFNDAYQAVGTDDALVPQLNNTIS